MGLFLAFIVLGFMGIGVAELLLILGVLLVPAGLLVGVVILIVRYFRLKERNRFLEQEYNRLTRGVS